MVKEWALCTVRGDSKCILGKSDREHFEHRWENNFKNCV
jgi:hypothetical protein